jgi:hypothetical protein
LFWYHPAIAPLQESRVYISRSIMWLIFAAYVFAPTAFGWMIDPGGAWYRPYIIWAGIVLAAFLLQPRTTDSENEL